MESPWVHQTGGAGYTSLPTPMPIQMLTPSRMSGNTQNHEAMNVLSDAAAGPAHAIANRLFAILVLPDMTQPWVAPPAPKAG